MNLSKGSLYQRNSTDTDVPILHLNLSINTGIVFTKVYDKPSDFHLMYIISRSLMAMSLGAPLMVCFYLNLRIRFASVSSHISDFNSRNKFVTANLLKQGYRYHKPRKAFSNFYQRHNRLICINVFLILNSMEIWYINLRN